MTFRHQVVAVGFLAAAFLVSGCLGLSRDVEPPPVDGAGTPVAESERESDAESDESPRGVVYGDGVSLAESVPISDILDNVDAHAGRRVRVEGLITAVCEHRGCWIDLAGDREFETFRVKVEDGVIVFPMEVRGKYAVAEGVVSRLDPDRPHDTGQGLHGGEGEGRQMGGAHGEPGAGDGRHANAEGMVVRLDATGAVIRDRP